jgi:membrane protease YdiL (CAAX protease family)
MEENDGESPELSRENALSTGEAQAAPSVKASKAHIVPVLLLILVCCIILLFALGLLSRGPVLDSLVYLLPLMVAIALFVFIAVLAFYHGPSFRKYYRQGLVAGTIIVLLSLPATIISLTSLDMASLFKQVQAHPLSAPQLSLFSAVLLVMAVFAKLFAAGWDMVVYVVAAGEAEHLPTRGLVFFRRDGVPQWKPLAGALLFGVAAGVVSTILGKAVGMDISDALKDWLALFPGLTTLSPLLQVTFYLSMVISPAIFEELEFRGVLQNFFSRLSGNNMAAINASIVVISLLWALMHLENTNLPLLKCTQIFIIGLVFSEFARRYGIGTSLVSHLALNITAVCMAIQ